MPHDGPILHMPGAKNTTVWSFLFDSEHTQHRAEFCDADTAQRIQFEILKNCCVAFSTELVCTFGIQPGDKICVLCRNSIWYPVVVFSGLRVGAIVSPTSPECTSQEAAHILETVQPKLVIVDTTSYQAVKNCLERLVAPKLTLIALAAKDGTDLCLSSVQQLSTQGTAKPAVSAWAIGSDRSSANYCALLCFTSGTTALPKATMISHHNILAQLHQIRAFTRSNPARLVLGVLPFYHITGIVHLLHLPLLLDQEIVIMSHFELPSMLKTISKFKCEELWLVPPLLIRLVSDPKVNHSDLQSVRQFNTGAAPLGREVVRKLATQYPHIALRQAWGMTETCSCLTMTPPCDQTYENAHTVGKVVAGTRLKVVVPGTDTEVDEGKSGELLAQGPQVMMGYFDNPAATHSIMTFDGFLRTGDIGYLDNHGFVHIQDRIKEIIKVKGISVAPAELENILMGHDGVQDAAVMGTPDSYSGQVPKAYVVLKPSFGASVEVALSIMGYVKQKCTKSKWLRGGIAFVDAVPKSSSGKILRRRLVDLEVILDVDNKGDLRARL